MLKALRPSRAAAGPRSSTRSSKSSNASDAPEIVVDPLDLTDFSSSSLPLPPYVEKHFPKLHKDSKLAPLDLKFDLVREEEYTISLYKAHRKALKLQSVAAAAAASTSSGDGGSRSNNKARASVLFLVRRPGCVLCQEQGLDLFQLIQDEFPAQSVAGFACVKETHKDDENLLKLYQNYFQFPFYRDTNLNLFKALGDKKVNFAKALLSYPFNTYKKRWENKGLKGTVMGQGEGLILGGVMIFNRAGQLHYACQEKYGTELPLDDIRTSIQELVGQDDFEFSASSRLDCSSSRLHY